MPAADFPSAVAARSENSRRPAPHAARTLVAAWSRVPATDWPHSRTRSAAEIPPRPAARKASAARAPQFLPSAEPPESDAHCPDALSPAAPKPNSSPPRLAQRKFPAPVAPPYSNSGNPGRSPRPHAAAAPAATTNPPFRRAPANENRRPHRSEEHTSEL